jgi:hypothetical protein
MTTATVGQPGFSIGRVASMTFGAIGRNLLPFLLLSAMAIIPSALVSFFLVQGVQNGGQVSPSNFLTISFWIAFVASYLVALVLIFLLQAALVQGTIADLNGRKVSVIEALKSSIRVFLPLVGLEIVTSVGVGVAFVALIFPGFMLLTAWLVGVPVLVVERKPILDSLSRSAELTKGYRWPLFGTIVVFYLGAAILQLAVRPIFGLTLVAPSVGAMSVAYIALDSVVRIFTSMVSTAGVATIYYELRSVKEGVGPEQLASVFD